MIYCTYINKVITDDVLLIHMYIYILVCGAINSTMENITFPSDADTLRSLKADFLKIAHFPNCVGAIDGTLIPIKEMSGLGEPAFICRKNFCALNIQAVADPNMR